MSGHTIRLTSASARKEARRLIDAAPAGFVMAIREPVRSLEQNDYMWEILGKISRAKPMGIVETPDGWKALAMHACGHEVAFMQGLDGRPFPVGFRSSKMTKEQMSQLIDWLLVFCAEQGVTLNEPANAP
jgi:hypothetical protein